MNERLGPSDLEPEERDLHNILAALPPVLIAVIFQRYIVNGVRIAGMK